MTLASQWKSQFDDSEETTDNEWKPESPEHKPALAGAPQAIIPQGEGLAQASVPPALSRISEDSRTSHRRCVNIAGIENYPELMGEFDFVSYILAFLVCTHARSFLRYREGDS